MRGFCMAGHGVGENGLSDLGPSNQHSPHLILHGTHHPVTTYIDQQESAFNFGELEEAIVYQGIKSGDDEAKKALFSTRPSATLEMFPSWPMRFQQTHKGSSTSGGESTDSGSAQKPSSYKIDALVVESESPNHHHQKAQQKQLVKMASNVSRTGPPPPPPPHNQLSKTQEKRKGPGSTSDKPLDAKTLRRLAQNREAARKSRLRKKAYVHQLETSRLKLTHLEQDLQRARSQGLFLAAGAGTGGNLSNAAALFDMEYARWLDEDRRHVAELQTALQAHLSDNDLRLMLDGYLAHYDEIFQYKGVAAKSDVFHLITGMWATPAERCFNWMGGFRPSDLLKMLMPHLDPLTEQQLMGICSLQQSSQQAEEALSQGLEQLHVSLSETISSGPLSEGTNVQNYMGQMALALGQISNLEGFVRQADNLRQQTLHQLRRILTVRQAARCFLAIGEYYNRLRALSSIWGSRPRETILSEDTSCQTSMDFQVVQTPRNHFSNF